MRSNYFKIDKLALASALIVSTSLLQAFDFGGLVESATQAYSQDKKQSTQKIDTKPNLSSDIVSDGLKQALKSGVDFGISELSKDGGYLNNASVKIPLPKNLATAESLIRKAGGDKIANDLINSMNNAATKAAPKTASIFIEAIDKMSIDDAKGILAGDNHAATEYFKTHTTKDLQEMIQPIIEETMAENNVASYYDTFNDTYKEYGKGLVESSGVMDLAKSVGADSYLPSATDENLNEYVTNKAIDGLFKMIAEKEDEIRKDPIAQTTSILKEVFGK